MVTTLLRPCGRHRRFAVCRNTASTKARQKQILNSHFVNLLGYVGLLTGVVASAAMTAAKRLVFGIANAGCERDRAANRQLASQGKHTRALATFTRLAFTRDALDQHIKKGGKVPQSITDNPLLMQQHATQLPTRRGRKAKNANKTVANQVTRPFPLYYQSKSKERREFLEARKRAKQQEQGPEGQQQLVVHSNESHSGLVAALRGANAEDGQPSREARATQTRSEIDRASNLGSTVLSQNGMRIPLCKRIGPQCGDATLAPLDLGHTPGVRKRDRDRAERRAARAIAAATPDLCGGGDGAVEVGGQEVKVDWGGRVARHTASPRSVRGND